MRVRTTGRWRGIVAVALFFVAVGVIADRPATLLVGVVGAAFAVYPRLSGPPAVDLELERRLDDSRPAHGEPVTVVSPSWAPVMSRAMTVAGSNWWRP